MQLTGFFVEYLIIGSTSLIWVLPLLQAAEIEVPENKAIIALLAPALYVIGMVLDVIGHYVTKKHRRKIRDAAKAKYMKRYGLTKAELATVDVELFTMSVDLAKAAIARTSRARVARGSLTNALFAAPILIVTQWNNLEVIGVVIAISLGILAIGGLWKIWARWQRLSYRFEIKALSASGPKKTHNPAMQPTQSQTV